MNSSQPSLSITGPGIIASASLFMSVMGSTSFAERLPDIRTIPQDLNVPQMTEEDPAPGRRVKQIATEYQGTRVYHSLFLSTDWQQGKLHPVSVEYAGNGPYTSEFGDVCTGQVQDCNLGYGISGGKGFIWVCLPFISQDRKHNQSLWWGDVEATVDYCKVIVPEVCETYGGDPSAVFLAGFSRGAIACNFVGLFDDQIAHLWLGFILHSHYDGVKKWDYAGSDRDSAVRRLKRLWERSQFISHETSVEETRRYLSEVCPTGAFAFQALPYRNHTDTWVLRDIPERTAVRNWAATILKTSRRDTKTYKASVDQKVTR